jgi:shikimate kinase
VNVAIIGMRGVGKSNVSRRLALLLKRPALSTDALVEYESGLSIPAFVAQRGWREFREMEYQVVRKAAALDGVIIDCGGGVIVDLDDDGDEVFSDRKVTALKEHGRVVWLGGDVARLASKMTGDWRRPVLDTRRDLEALMRSRMPFYRRAADLVIDVEGRRRSSIARQIATWAATPA